MTGLFGVDTANVTGLRLFGLLVTGYMAVLAAVVVGGFLYQAVGLWLAVVWGIGLAALLAASFHWRRRA
jgi:hypothetical protein